MSQQSEARCCTRGHVRATLREPVAERAREDLPATIGAGRVLRRKEHKVRVRRERLARLGDVQLAIVVEQPVQRLVPAPPRVSSPVWVQSRWVVR